MTQHEVVSGDVRHVVVLDPDAVERIPWEPLRDLPGVAHKVLLRSGDTVFGLIRFEPGASEPGHAHHAASHEVWVIRGEVTMAGRRLSAGSFVHVPAGVVHETTDVGPDGCTCLYTFRAQG